MTGVVLDASAVLTVLLGELGAAAVAPHLAAARISAVNYSEVLARTARLCGSLEEAKLRVDRHGIRVVPFEAEHAVLAASLGPATRNLGLSLGDRACLALGLSLHLTVLTADRVWAKLDLGVAIECVR